MGAGVSAGVGVDALVQPGWSGRCHGRRSARVAWVLECACGVGARVWASWHFTRRSPAASLRPGGAWQQALQHFEYLGAYRFGDGRSRPAEPPHSNICGGLRVCFFVFEELSELFWETVGRPLLKDLESLFGEANGAQS